MSEFYGSRLNTYLSYVFGLTQNHFRDPSLKHYLDICITNNSAADIQLNLTRNVIKNLTARLGEAIIGSICSSSNKIIVRDRVASSTGAVIAHELTHILGINHINDCGKQYEVHNKFLMNKDYNMYNHLWSHCISNQLNVLLEHKKSCLTCKKDCVLKLRYKPPTFLTSTNYQCYQLTNHNKSTLRSSAIPCRELNCNHTGYNIIHYYNWNDGTPCGENHVCYQGLCRKQPIENYKGTDGYWGQWQQPSHCKCGVSTYSRPCLGQSSGGKYCLGRKKKHVMCSFKFCSIQDNCNLFNKNFSLSFVPDTNIWRSTIGINNCQVYCVNSLTDRTFILRKKALDGTLCHNSGMCLGGVCRNIKFEKFVF